MLTFSAKSHIQNLEYCTRWWLCHLHRDWLHSRLCFPCFISLLSAHAKWILHNCYITIQEPVYFTSSVKYKVITLLRTIRAFWSTLHIVKHAVFLNIQLNLKINSIVFLPMTNRTISINYFLWIYCIKLPWLLLLFPICSRHRAIVRDSCLQAKPALCRQMSTLEKEIGFWGQSESWLVLNQLTNCSTRRVRAKSGIF